MVRMNTSTTVSFKIDKTLKKTAQDTATSMGIPLSTVISAFLKDFAATGRFEIVATEAMTPQMERLIEVFQDEIKAGEVSDKFTSGETAEKHLRSL